MEKYLYNISYELENWENLLKCTCSISENEEKYLLKWDINISEKSIFFNWDWKKNLDDYSILLSVFQWNYISYYNNNLLKIDNPKDFKLFLSDEIWDFLNISMNKFKKIKLENENIFYILKRSLFLYYEIKYISLYKESKNILSMHLFEFLLWSIYRIDKNLNNNMDVDFKTAYCYLCNKFDYQKFIDEKVHLNSKENKQWSRKRVCIADFSEQFRLMRNWIQHWKQQNKPEFSNSQSDTEFTFFYRLESFSRFILADLIYWKDFKRKFDILNQLILEKNVFFHQHQII